MPTTVIRVETSERKSVPPWGTFIDGRRTFDKNLIVQSWTGNYFFFEVEDIFSVFWIANIQNYFHDNAAVGGHVGIWSFTHTSTRDYAYQAIPKDPVTGQRVWRNNKASAAEHGFIMDNSVKDQLPTADEPTPQVIPLSRLKLSQRWVILCRGYFVFGRLQRILVIFGFWKKKQNKSPDTGSQFLVWNGSWHFSSNVFYERMWRMWSWPATEPFW